MAQPSCFDYSRFADVTSKESFAILFPSFNYFWRPEKNDTFDINSVLSILIQSFPFSILCSRLEIQNYVVLAVICIQSVMLMEIILQFQVYPKSKANINYSVISFLFPIYR